MLAEQFLESLQRYFRVELHGAVDELPPWPSQPTIFIMNHTALVGLEVYLLHGALARHRPGSPRIRTTVWDQFLKVPLLGHWYRSAGCLAMNVDAVAEQLRSGKSVLILPEGPDATDVRDEVGPFHAGFLRVVRKLSSEMQVPVVPLGWSGVDEANPWFVTTNQTLVKLLMKPAMPAFDFALLPRFPLLRPSKVVFVAGAPLEFSAAELADESDLRAQVSRVRSIVLTLVQEARALRARRINQSMVERGLHAAFRMRDVLWKRH